MMWLIKLCLFAKVALGIHQRDVYVSASNITWEPMQIPLVFGKDVGIRCSYHNLLSCNDPIIWTWYTGTDNELIMTNGTLSEEFKHQHKYSEITSSCLQISTLIVSNFNESDYNQTYKCGIAIIKQFGRSFAENIKDKITFENTSYEYVPSDEMISTEIKLLPDQNISITAEIERVYPVPDCEATFKDEDITTGLKIQKKKKSIFYHVYISLTLNHTSVEYVKTICIKCKGTESWWYLTKSWNPYCTDKPTTNKSGFFLAVIVNVYSTSYILISAVVLLVLFFSRNDKFEMIMTNLYIVDLFHCFLASGILLGYTETTSMDNRDIFRQHGQYGYVLNIIKRIGGVKCIAFLIVVIIVLRTVLKTTIKIGDKIDFAEYVTFLSNTLLAVLLLFLFEKEGIDGSKETASAWHDLNTVQYFLPARSFCCYMLRRLHNTEDTADKVGDNKRETHALLMDKEHDAESFGGFETNVIQVDIENDCKYFGSSETHVLLVDKEHDAESFGGFVTNVIQVDIENDGKSFGSSETDAPLMDKEYDTESVESFDTHVPLMVKEKDAESLESSGSYNTAYKSSNDEESEF